MDYTWLLDVFWLRLDGIILPWVDVIVRFSVNGPLMGDDGGRGSLESCNACVSVHTGFIFDYKSERMTDI